VNALFLSLALLGQPTVTDTEIVAHEEAIPRFVRHYENVLVVPAETTVTLPADATYDAIEVSGTLRVSREHDTVCRTIHLTVLPGGILDLGTEADPIPAKRRVEMVFRDAPLRTGTVASPDIDPYQLGNGLLVFGSFNAHGRKLARTWTTLREEVRAGAKELRFDVPAGWQVGDELLIPDSRQPWYKSAVEGQGEPVRRESPVRIAAIDGDRVTLSKPLDFEHLAARDPDGQVRFMPYVANATRNVLLRSENPGGTRGHTMFFEMAHIDCRYASFVGLGRTQATSIDNTESTDGELSKIGTNQIARYAFHWHHVHGHTDHVGLTGRAIGNYLDGLDGNKWGLVQHGTHDVLVSDNIATRFIGAGFITEDGYEVRGQYLRNFAAHIPGNRKSALECEAEKIPGGEGAGFWFRGMGQTIRSNVSTNNAIGYQFFYRTQEQGHTVPSSPDSDHDTLLDPTKVIPLALEDNVAAANRVGFESWNNPIYEYVRAIAWHNHTGFLAGNGQPGSISLRDAIILQVRGDGVSSSAAYTGSLSIHGGEILGCDVGVYEARNFVQLASVVMQNKISLNYYGARATQTTLDGVLFKPLRGAKQFIQLGQGLAWNHGEELPRWSIVPPWSPNTGKRFVVKNWQREGNDYLLFENAQKRKQAALPAIGYAARWCPEAGLSNGECWDRYGIGYYGGVIAENEAIELPGLMHGVAKAGLDYPLGTPRLVLPQPNMLAAVQPDDLTHFHFVLTGDGSRGNDFGRVRIDDGPVIRLKPEQYDAADGVHLVAARYLTPGQHTVKTWRDDVYGRRIDESELTFRYFVGDALPNSTPTVASAVIAAPSR
jgi:hypothetical protein